MSTPKRIQALHQLEFGVQVLTPDGEAWTVVARSYVGTQTLGKKKWVWLRQGNTYRKVMGSTAMYALRLIPKDTP